MVSLCELLNIKITATITRISPEPAEGTVGAAQDIICSVETVNNFTSVTTNWSTANGTIVENDRISVTQTIQVNTIVTILHFDYLMEGDEGNYTCNVIIDGNVESASTALQNLHGKNVMCSMLVNSYSITYKKYFMMCNVCKGPIVVSFAHFYVLTLVIMNLRWICIIFFSSNSYCSSYCTV